MNHYTNLFRRLGATTRKAADEESLARVEKAFSVHFPTELRELYLTTDGLILSDGEMEILPLSRVEEYAGALVNYPFGYVPFTDCNDSNPYVVCCDQPLVGFVAHVFHDDETVLICRSVVRFFELIGDLNITCDRVAGDLAFDQSQRSAEDADIGRALINCSEGLNRNDYGRTEALRLATQMFGPGDEADLAAVLARGDEYVRRAVLRRCRCLGTSASEAIRQSDAREFNQFIARLAKSLVAAGIEVKRRPAPDHGFTIERGNIHLNFEMLYHQRDEERFLEDLLQRIQRWQSERKR